MEREAGTENLVIRYGVLEGTAKLLRCYGGGPVVRVPETLQGLPVTAIGDYAFAPPESESRVREEERRSGEIHTVELTCGAFGKPELEAVLGGNLISEVLLPDTVRSIGNYAFYNCRKLERLYLTDSLAQVESSAFMNCESLARIDMRLLRGEKSCLKALTAGMQRQLHISLHYAFLEGRGQKAELTFPEFYEESMENVPAKIFGLFIRGSGYNYRQCFQDGAFNFREYDSLFPNVRQRDSAELAVNMALERLRYPFRLMPESREAYLSYLKEQCGAAASQFIRADDLERLEFLGSLELWQPGGLDGPIELASRLGRTECLGFLLDYKHRHFSSRDKCFDL